MRVITAFFMSIILPLLSLFGAGTKYSGEKTFNDKPEQVKEERAVFDYVPGKYDIFVSPAGDDSADGTKEAPLKTVSAACEKAAKLNSDEGIQIILRDGKYVFDKTLKLDSGFPENVTFASYPGEKAVFTACVPVEGFSETTVNGVRAFSAKAQGSFKPKTLIKGDSVLPVTRYPESGYFYLPEQSYFKSMYTEENTPWSMAVGDLSFDCSTDQKIRDFHNIGDVTLRMMHYWCAEVSFLQEYKSDKGTYLITKPLSMTAKKGDRYYFENVFEALDKPGEWYYDSAEGIIYYIPEEGEKAESTVLYAAVTDRLFDISGTKGIKFYGIEFSGTDWSYPDIAQSDGYFASARLKHPQAEYDSTGAIQITKSTGTEFTNCDFCNLGNTAVKFNRFCKDFSVCGCNFKNIGACAIIINGDNTEDDSSVTENAVITDNLIKGYGRNFAAAVGVLITSARNIEISSNEICDGYYTGISVGWTWGYGFNVTNNIKIRNNLIYDIGHGWLSDMGGIYTLGIQPDTEITGNVIYNVAADKGEGGYGGWGIYLDEGSSGILVARNLVYDCGSQSFHQHYGKDNILTNNIFALSDLGQVRSSKHEEHTAFILKNNIIVSDGSPAYTNLDGGVFKDENNLYWDYSWGKNIISVDGENIDVLKNRYTVHFMQKRGLYNGAVFADPLFRDARNFDFTLAQESPALTAIGFEPFDYNAGTLTKH